MFYQVGAGAAAGRADLHAGVHEALAAQAPGRPTDRLLRRRRRDGPDHEHRRARRRAPDRGQRPGRRRGLQSPGPLPRPLRTATSPTSPRPTGSSPRPSPTAYGRRTRRRTARSSSWPRRSTARPRPWPSPQGKGSVLLLPSFGAKNVEVVEYILKDRLPLGAEPRRGARDRLARRGGIRLPRAQDAHRPPGRGRSASTMVLADYDRQLKELKAGGQEEFHRLLKGEGAALKKAVVHAFRYLGWGRVVDVDEYWKNTIRNKEEDAWLLEPGDTPVEAGIRKGELVIILVRGGKNWATDDDCALLQKYKGRRMQEFDNTRMKAVLVGNYFSAVPAKDRQCPFSAAQIEEAQKDGNGLMTTWELFRAVQAEKENRISKDALREQIRLKTGLMTFDI
ncbi:MAG: hypothetical protein MZU84_05840 [Sphingobacterium sp.]|nr:hypothetical protein [Sphingobacterium sp.]